MEAALEPRFRKSRPGAVHRADGAPLLGLDVIVARSQVPGAIRPAMNSRQRVTAVGGVSVWAPA